VREKMVKPYEDLKIKYVGLKQLDDFEIAELRDIIERGYNKVMRDTHLKNAQLTVDVKKINAEGAAKLYRIILRLVSPGTKKGWFDVRHEDWELARAVHRAIDNLKENIKHTLKKERGGVYEDV